MREYKDPYTLDGRLRPGPGVSKAKLAATKTYLEKALSGDLQADGVLREAATTSDAVFNLAYLTNLSLIPQFDEAPRTWSQIAGVRVVPDFDNITLASVFNQTSVGVLGANGELPTVPELAPYPKIKLAGVEAQTASFGKKGASFQLSWEARRKDVAGFFEQLPSELLQIALDTEEADVYNALLAGLDASNELDGGTLPDGTVVPPNAPITPAAIWQAILELGQRTVNGRNIQVAGGYNVLVPVGLKAFIDWQLNNTLATIEDGNLTFSAGPQTQLAGVTVIETPFFTGTQWAVIPKPGSVRRPVLELARLRGYESPELRIENAAGNYIGGGAVSPYEGDFTADIISMRLRVVGGGIMWDGVYVVHSDGSGS